MLMQTLHDIRDQLPGCLSTSVVSLHDGLSIATSSVDMTKSAGSDAFHANVYGLLSSVLNEVGSDEHAETIVIESEHLTFVSSPIGDSGFFWHVVTDRNTTLGFTQAMMRKYGASVSEALFDLIGH